CVVDQHVDAAEVGQDIARGLRDLARVGDVARVDARLAAPELPDALERVACARLVGAVVHRDVVVAPRELDRGGRADPGARSRDYGYSVRHAEIIRRRT